MLARDLPLFLNRNHWPTSNGAKSDSLENADAESGRQSKEYAIDSSHQKRRYAPSLPLLHETLLMQVHILPRITKCFRPSSRREVCTVVGVGSEGLTILHSLMLPVSLYCKYYVPSRLDKVKIIS